MYRYKSPILLGDVDIKNLLVSNKIYSDEKNFKYVIDHLYDDYKTKSLYLMLPNLKAYLKSYVGQTKWMYFLTEDDQLLKKRKNIITCRKK